MPGLAGAIPAQSIIYYNNNLLKKPATGNIFLPTKEPRYKQKQRFFKKNRPFPGALPPGISGAGFLKFGQESVMHKRPEHFYGIIIPVRVNTVGKQQDHNTAKHVQPH